MLSFWVKTHINSYSFFLTKVQVIIFPRAKFTIEMEYLRINSRRHGSHVFFFRLFWKLCQAAEVCGTLEIDSALDTVGALGRDLEAYEKSIEEGNLLPLPGDTVSIHREH